MSKQEKIRGVRGMNDILPTDEALWSRLEDAVASTMLSYGYRRIRTPILEQTGLFVRGIGEGTDIVEKEKYSFTAQWRSADLASGKYRRRRAGDGGTQPHL